MPGFFPVRTKRETPGCQIVKISIRAIVQYVSRRCLLGSLYDEAVEQGVIVFDVHILILRQVDDA